MKSSHTFFTLKCFPPNQRAGESLVNIHHVYIPALKPATVKYSALIWYIFAFTLMKLYIYLCTDCVVLLFRVNLMDYLKEFSITVITDVKD